MIIMNLNLKCLQCIKSSFEPKLFLFFGITNLHVNIFVTQFFGTLSNIQFCTKILAKSPFLMCAAWCTQTHSNVQNIFPRNFIKEDIHINNKIKLCTQFPIFSSFIASMYTVHIVHCTLVMLYINLSSVWECFNESSR